MDSFGKIAGQFPFGSSWIGRPFVRHAGDPSMWERVESVTGPSACAELRAALLAMEPRFTAIWDKDLPRLESLRTRLVDRLNVTEVGPAITALEKYLACSFPRVEVHLVLSRGEKSVSGGANEGPGHITLRALETADPGWAVETVFHEVMHLMEGKRFRPLYERASQRYRLREYVGEDDWNAHWLVKEALAGAVVPGGCLSPFLKQPLCDHTEDAARAARRGDLREAGLTRLTGLYLPLVGDYVESSRAVDEGLFDQAFRTFSGEAGGSGGLGIRCPGGGATHHTSANGFFTMTPE